jgi:hypothetical protein
VNRIATFAIGLAGLIHIVIAPQHYAHSPAHGIFFAVAGIAEIAWALAFLRQPTKEMYYAGLALAGGLVLLWAFTRFLPAPFHDDPEAIDLGGIVCKLSELAGLGVLLLMAAQGRILGLAKQSTARLLVTTVLVGVAAAGITYTLARAAEPFMPALAGQVHQEHDPDDHDHEEGEHEEHEHND